jgi:hypothetical protein
MQTDDTEEAFACFYAAYIVECIRAGVYPLSTTALQELLASL